MVDRAPVSVLAIDHVQVAAPEGCEHEARAFYGVLLGLEELSKPEALRDRGGCWFRVGGQELHVGVDRPFAPARKAHPSLVVSDLAGLAGRLADAGIAVQPDDAIPGLKRFYAADPFGNRLEFRQA
jgi:catechol 2,3-dioxygenase-like lactoylglutathione lyase family enzyme